MTAYCTPELVRLALVPTSNGAQPDPPSNTAADLTDAQLIDAIAEAQALVDGYLRARYATPVEPTGDPAVFHSTIVYWTRNLALYEATNTYRGSMDYSDSDPVARRYKATMEALKDVAAGKIVLDLPGVGGGSSDTGAGSVDPAINPYVGELFGPDDWLQESNLGTTTPWYGPYWTSP
jgi:phage gp36-like protein